MRIQLVKQIFKHYFEIRMPAIMNGPKSHDIEHHLLEDIMAHGNPAGFDVNFLKISELILFEDPIDCSVHQERRRCVSRN